MLRKIIKIDEEKCNGCGLCASACHEGAIGMVDGKAKLLREDYCDGLGDCLPACPTNAISFEEREAAAYDEAAVKMSKEAPSANIPETLPCGCPGTHAKAISHKAEPASSCVREKEAASSHLNSWPVQIKLAPVNAPYFAKAKLLIAADCCAYAYGAFHEDFMKDKITLIGCPKLDEGDYTQKLTGIISKNDIKSITVARMEVPCCAGIVKSTTEALKNSAKMIPWQVVTFATDGSIVEE